MKDIKELTETLSAPLGQLIAELGRGVAEAQQDMDKKTLELLADIYQNNPENYRVLQEIGYRPNWYHIPEAEAEINVSLTMTGDYSRSRNKTGAGMRLLATPMNATYQNSFGYKVEASSRLKFKIVPIPEPTESENRHVMPNVLELTVKQAIDMLNRLQIQYDVIDENGQLIDGPNEEQLEKIVTDQVPAAGSLFAEGSEVKIQFAK